MLGLCVRAAAAQSSASRFWASLGGGVGRSGPSNSTGLDQFSGPSGDVALGVVMTSRGLIGLEVADWRRATPNGSSRSTFATLTLLGYPFGSVLSNLYIQGGLGVGNASFPTRQVTTTPTRLNVTHPSLQVGVGYDVPIACPLWITPFLQSYGTFGGSRFKGTPLPSTESQNAVLFHAGVLLRFAHPGAAECRNRGAALGR